MLSLFLSACIGYLCGSVSTGLLLAQAMGGDLRQSGSGNIGATNVSRVLGKRAGLITLIGDMAKVWVALLLVHLFSDSENLLIIAGTSAVLGHIFPLYYNFKGGKGVASGLALYIALAPAVAFIVAILFVVLVKLSRYVSLASVVGAASLPLLLFLISNNAALLASSVTVSVMIILKHKENIQRLMNGVENKI